MTVGVEEELMLVNARTFELEPRAHEVLAAAGGDPRFKPELPAAQLEIAVPPAGAGGGSGTGGPPPRPGRHRGDRGAGALLGGRRPAPLVGAGGPGPPCAQLRAHRGRVWR